MTAKIVYSMNGIKAFKLGRNKPLSRGPRIKLGDFLLASAAPPPPGTENWIRLGSTPIYHTMEDILGNDQYGDCTCAGAGHLLDVLRANNNKADAWRAATRDDALAFYARVTSPAFDPATGANDNGADEQTVLNTWQKDGFFSDGTGKIEAWATVNASNIEEMKQAIWLFGNLYFGISLPDMWVNPAPSQSGFTWTVAGDPDPNNGHCFIGYGYNSNGVLIDTWGMFGTLTWAAVQKYCAANVGELYVVLGQDWEDAVTQKSPGGVAVDQLKAYINTLFK